MVVSRAGGWWGSWGDVFFGGWGDMFFKGTHLKLVVKSILDIRAQHSDYSQPYGVVNVKVAKRLDLNCSHHKKRNGNYVK